MEICLKGSSSGEHKCALNFIAGILHIRYGCFFNVYKWKKSHGSPKHWGSSSATINVHSRCHALICHRPKCCGGTRQKVMKVIGSSSKNPEHVNKIECKASRLLRYSMFVPLCHLSVQATTHYRHIIDHDICLTLVFDDTLHNQHQNLEFEPGKCGISQVTLFACWNSNSRMWLL